MISSSAGGVISHRWLRAVEASNGLRRTWTLTFNDTVITYFTESFSSFSWSSFASKTCTLSWSWFIVCLCFLDFWKKKGKLSKVRDYNKINILQSNPVKKVTEGAIESVHINGVSVLSGCQKSRAWLYHWFDFIAIYGHPDKKTEE